MAELKAGAAALLIGLAAGGGTSCAPITPLPGPAPFAAEAPAGRAAPPADCGAPGWEAAAQINASSLRGLYWAPFGREEVGWRIYAPLIAHEIGAACPPDSPAFARALAAWQQGQGLAPDGLMSALTFLQAKGVLQARRPFVLLSVQGICAAPADPASLETLRPEEQLGERPVQLSRGALAAWRRMAAAARAEEPALAADPDLLKLFSGYRSPEFDAARCAAQANCNGRERANCSAHRTGLALDLYLGHAPGYLADASADENRLYLTQTPAYRWLLANAGRFGFVNYAFEPWHWEWIGEPLRAPPGLSAAQTPARPGRSADP